MCAFMRAGGGELPPAPPARGRVERPGRGAVSRVSGAGHSFEVWVDCLLQARALTGASGPSLMREGDWPGFRTVQASASPPITRQPDPLARLVVEAPHITGLIEGIQQDFAALD